MQSRNYKKAIVFAMVLTMLMPLGSMAASSTEEDADTTVTSEADAAENSEEAEDTEEDPDADEDSEGEEDAKADEDDDDDEAAELITDEEALALCEEAASNDKYVLYMDKDNDRWCLYVKSSGKCWWSSPINVMADESIADVNKSSSMKSGTRKQIASSLAIKTGDLRQEKRTESSEIYSTKARLKWKTEKDGFSVTYNYASEGVKLVVHYQLCDDNLYIYVDTSEIEEENTSTVDGNVITKLQLAPSFAAAPAVDVDGNPVEGYMIVPDGSGAVINYNNGKNNYSDYSQIVYGRDYTAVPLSAPRVTEQAYMPVMATVSGNDGIVMVATEGDANVYAKARVSGQDKQVYNTCWFEFELRSTDTFFMSGDSSNRITVFEKNGIKTDRFGVRYYPIENDEGVNYADCAAVYRDYLINSKGLTAKTEANSVDMHLDLFGGVVKQTSILGLPFNLKTEITGFKQAQEIVDQFKNSGVESIVVNYNDWTNKSIKNKVSTKAKASGVLGGNGAFMDFVGTDGVDVFPSMNNIQMDSGSWGYTTFNSTAIRISNAYSRQSSYSPAFGVEEKGVSPALLAPNTYTKMFDEMLDSYKDKSLTNIGFGDFSTKLVSDYSKKKQSSRNDTMNTLVEGYTKASADMSIICDGANAYLLPYASEVTNVPVYSSGFNITDMDIPFYQMVIHGYVPYSTKPINASSNTGETFMLALAAGSNIHYDLVYEDASVLKDTDYDDLYYTNYKGWMDMATAQYKVTKEVLAGVSDMVISKYEVSDDGNVITTTYSKDGTNVVVEVDKAAGTAKVDGKLIDLGDAIEGGIDG